MPKIKHVAKVHVMMNLPEEQRKLMLGMIVMYCLQEKKITLAELETLHAEMLDGLAKKSRR